MKKRFTAYLLLSAILCSLLFSGCSKETTIDGKDAEENGIRMDRYLTLYSEGWDGYGYLGADIDFAQMKEDCGNHLTADATEDRLAAIFEDLQSNDIVENTENDGALKNGDIVEFVVSVPKDLQSLVTVELKPAAVKYTVKGLEDFSGVDPFEFIDVYYKDGVGTYALSETATSMILTPLGIEQTLTGITVNADAGKEYRNGDTVYVKLSDETISSYAEKYKDDFFTRTEGEILLKYLPELPATEDQAREFLSLFSEECQDNANYAVKSLMDNKTDEETTVECIGRMLYFNENTNYTEGDWSNHNQLVLIYKITSVSNTDGWYTYMAYHGDMVFAWILNRGTIELERSTTDGLGYSLVDDPRYYDKDSTPFECNGKTYYGQMNLKDLIAALGNRFTTNKSYDHLVVTDSLAGYVTEY